jgi:LysM repeat protein
VSFISRRGTRRGKLQHKRNRWRGIVSAVIGLITAGLGTACVDQSTEPTPLAYVPVSSKEDSGSAVTARPMSPKRMGSTSARLPSTPQYVIVEHGQSLDGIAHSHHLPPAALAAANHLKAPYPLKVGSQLLLPNTGPRPLQQANAWGVPPSDPITSAPASTTEQHGGSNRRSSAAAEADASSACLA